MNQFNKRVRGNTGNIFNINYEDDSNNGGGGGGGSSVVVINNLTTNDPDAALSAAQGVVIKGITDALEVVTNSNSTAIFSLNTRMTEAESELGALETVTNSNSTAIMNLTTRMTNAEDALDQVDQAISALETVTNSNSAAITSANTRITTLESETAALETVTNSNSTAIMGLDTRVTTLETNEGSTDSAIAALEAVTNSNSTAIFNLQAMVNQPVKTDSTPSFANATIYGQLFSGVLDRITIVESAISNNIDQPVKTGSTPSFSNATIAGQLFSGVVSRLSTAETTLSNDINQDVKTTSSPSFTGLTVNGTTWATLLSRIVTLEGYVDQAVKTTSSPSFSALTVGGTTFASVSSGVTTLTSNFNANINQSVKTTANPVFQSLLLRDGSDTTRFIHALSSAMATNSSVYICFGQANSAGNQAELGFTYQGANSAANELFLGFHSLKTIRFFNSGQVVIPGGLTLTSNTNTSAEGNMTWNGSTKVPRFYNGSSWVDVGTSSAASSTLGKVVGSLSYTYAKNSSGVVAEATFEATGIVSSAVMNGIGRIDITLSSDPGTIAASITTQGISGSLPAHLRFAGYRGNSTTFTVAGSTGAPPASDPTNIYNAMINLSTTVTNDTGFCLKIVLFRTV